MDMSRPRRFAELKKRIDRLKQELEPLEAEYDKLADPNGPMMRDFLQNGIDRLPIDGVTIYSERKVWASYPEGAEAAIEALRASSNGDYVNPHFNHQSVSALVREQYGDGLAGTSVLPPEWEGKIVPVEVYKLKAVKS